MGKMALAAALAVALSFGTAGVALAGDTYPYVGESAKGENQPYQHGYRVEDLMDWSPETDPYAPLLRARVPLQERNEPYAPTQADPGLGSRAQYLTLTGDYGNSFFNSSSYTNEFSTYAFNFWQYIDYYASWHGMPSVGTPEELDDVEDERNSTDGSAWERRYFEFGLVNLPNPAYTNAAHKNGALSLGCMFQPRAYQNFEVMLYQDEDGRYPVADKMVELARYYGFDGYFFNMEGRSYSNEAKTKLREFLAQMRADGLYIQWYNAGAFNSLMLTDEAGEDAANSMFIEYGCPVPGDFGAGDFDEFAVAFNGFEAGRDRYDNDFSRLYGEDGMLGSIASLGTDFVQTGLEQEVRYDEETGLRLFSRELDEYQWMAFQRERLWWTGNQNSRADVLDPGLTQEASAIGASDFVGVADYIAERSAINGKSFVTDFNTGHGLEYRVQGEPSSQAEWSNMNLQDYLPTWQWWFESSGTKLSAEFDYGEAYRKVYEDGTEGTFGFTPVGAYNGGSSLAVYGDLDARNFLHLYKTDLEVGSASQISVTFRKVSADDASMKLGLLFQDGDLAPTILDLEEVQTKGGWTTAVANLGEYAGKRVAVIGFVFEGKAKGYQMNLGQVKFTSGAAIESPVPTGLTVAKAYDTGEIVLTWNLDPYDQVKLYRLYAAKDGKEVFLGGIYDETYYVKKIDEALSDGQLTFVLKAVSEDGTESAGATVSYVYGDAVKNVSVDNSTDGQLALSWDGGQASVDVTTVYEDEPRTFSGSGAGSCTISVPAGAEADGAAVTITLTTADGVATTVDTSLPDHYCQPYDGTIGADQCLTQPSTSEWHVLYYQKVRDGKREETESYQRGGGDWSTFDVLPFQLDGLYVWLEDYQGNVSEEVYVPKNVETPPDEGAGEAAQGEDGVISQGQAAVGRLPEDSGAGTASVSGEAGTAQGAGPASHVALYAAVVLAVLVVALGIFLYWRKKKKK